MLDTSHLFTTTTTCTLLFLLLLQAMNVSFGAFRIVNSYGAFGSITKVRHEVGTVLVVVLVVVVVVVVIVVLVLVVILVWLNSHMFMSTIAGYSAGYK